MDLAGLRDRISVVFQDYMAYELSAAENIAVGDLARAQHVRPWWRPPGGPGIHDALEALPKGYDTLLTRSYFDLADPDEPADRRAAVGRAVAAARAGPGLPAGRPRPAILDEPSSGLDAEAEHQMHGSLRADRRGRTTVLISHRLNTVRDADQIVVLADGVIAEQGSHDALMAARHLRPAVLAAGPRLHRRPGRRRAQSAILSGSGHD